MPIAALPTVILEPRSMAHAEELFPVLAEAALYEFIHEEPPQSVEALRKKLARSESRKSPDGTEHWLNWVVRDASRNLAGYVQATVAANLETNVAYAIGSAFWGRGLASAAVAQMLQIVATDFGAKRFSIIIERENRRSIRLAERLGFSEAPVELAVRRGTPATDILFLKVLA
jgi:[ribosomal protein S5]-alanine N-acetyltransferase